jgi:Uma2 family endonuclease
MTALTLNLESITHLTHEQFRELCRDNRDIRLELTAKGELIVMPPTGWETGRRNSNLNLDLGLWNRQAGLGFVFDSSTGFILLNGAVRSPDAAWVISERLIALNPNPDGFLPLAPDFVIELRSASDSLKTSQNKMILNAKERAVEIYRPGQEVELLRSPTSLSGEAVLPGFVLNLKDIWD